MIAACAGCAKPRSSSPPDPVAEGRRIYLINCASCHNANPNLDGSLGPAIAGSSRALIEARVIHLSYPPGYHPKRATHLMRAMPWLAPQIDDLAAYLKAARSSQK